MDKNIEPVNKTNNTYINMKWQISVPIFRSKVILKQLGIAIGIPFGVIAAIIAISSGKSIYTVYALGMICALLFMTYLFMLLVYRGKYEVEYELNKKGVLCRTQKNQMKKNRVVNTLAIILGLLSGKPAVAGAGMLAQSRQVEFLKWKDIGSVKFRPNQQAILLRAAWTKNIAVFCTKDNYDQVAQMVYQSTGYKRN